MLNINIVKDKDIGLEYECLRLDSDALPEDIEEFFPHDWFWHYCRYNPPIRQDAVWDYIMWDFLRVKEWDVLVKCRVPTNEQIEESELLSYKSDKFLSGKRHLVEKKEWKKIWLNRCDCFAKMVFILCGENSILLYGKSMYENFRYLKI